ncbi:hypothetical protein [Streptomyces sp. AC627_RSS907]|nr:hypothetical protein [Streptomyces sp. AC627_RSS907]
MAFTHPAGIEERRALADVWPCAEAARERPALVTGPLGRRPGAVHDHR